MGKQQAQLFQVVLPEIADGPKIGLLPCGQKNEGDVLLERPGNPARTEYPSGIGIKVNLEHHGRVISRIALAGEFIVQAGKIQGFNDIVDHHAQILGLYEALNTRWEKLYLILVV
jgi:hypothetical protein